uniref:Uncharacterized protein n=1 Tax=Lactuca sativa TaxID=4236 RepID=A0A9R1UMV4_LACSA|nr:hypothetical protein LSAT_V11C800439380 [Lactuca sativa]
MVYDNNVLKILYVYHYTIKPLNDVTYVAKEGIIDLNVLKTPINVLSKKNLKENPRNMVELEHEVDLESHSEVEMEPDSEIDLFEVELKR